jgi:hypothetical protein
MLFISTWPHNIPNKVIKCKLLIIYMVHLTFNLITIGSLPLTIKLRTTYLMAIALGVIVHAYIY